jgi:acyl-CoA thioesterase-1
VTFGFMDGVHSGRDQTGRVCSRLMVVLLLAGFWLPGCGVVPASASKDRLNNAGGTILAVGDSLTEGLGVREDQAYPAVLERKLKSHGIGYRVINAGVSGETSSGTLSRIQWILRLKPDIVILVTGANDGLRGLDPDLTRSNLEKIVRQLKALDVVVVLGGMRMVQNLGDRYTRAFAGIYPAVAADQNVILIPFFLEGVAGESELNQPDGIHPTAEGYRRIVEHIYPYVEEAIRVYRQRQSE